MPYVKIHIPNGKKCKNFREGEFCRFNPSGTVWCEFFNAYLEEIDDYTNLKKCESCLAIGKHIKTAPNDCTR